MPRISRLLAILFAIVCIPTTTLRAQDTIPELHPRLLTAAEIARAGASDMLSVLRAVRPGWLRARAVYLNGTELGDLRTLAEVPAAGLRYARLVNRATVVNEGVRDAGATVIQLITTDGPAELTAESDAREFATPAWGVGPRLWVSAAIPGLYHNNRLSTLYHGGRGGSVAVSAPIRGAFSLRVQGTRVVDMQPFSNLVSARGSTASITSVEATAQGAWGNSSIVHPYVGAGGGYHWVTSTTDLYTSEGSGFTALGGVELNVVSHLITYAEGSLQMMRIRNDRTITMRYLRVGMSLELKRPRR